MTKDYTREINLLREQLESAEAIVIGAGAGLSTAAGLTYSGERFYRYFTEFHEKYGIKDMYSAGFYPFETLEEYWGLWSRHIMVNRYEPGAPLYKELLALVADKNYFVLTTNVDHQFQLAGFDKESLFYTQGDYGLWQCSVPCHPQTYDNETQVREMEAARKDLKIPTELIPRCPHCGAPMTMNLRCDDTFVEDAGWHAAAKRYSDFLQRYGNGHVLFLELGVGGNTPGIIKYPFWRMTLQNPNAVYACINLGEAVCPGQISDRAICIYGDIAAVLERLR